MIALIVGHEIFGGIHFKVFHVGLNSAHVKKLLFLLSELLFGLMKARGDDLLLVGYGMRCFLMLNELYVLFFFFFLLGLDPLLRRFHAYVIFDFLQL